MDRVADIHLEAGSLLQLPEGQFAQDVIESADLLCVEVVHEVQDILCGTRTMFNETPICCQTGRQQTLNFLVDLVDRSIYFFIFNFQCT